MPKLKISIEMDGNNSIEHCIDVSEQAWYIWNDNERNDFIDGEVKYILRQIKIEPDELKIAKDKLQLVTDFAHFGGLVGCKQDDAAYFIRAITQDQIDTSFSEEEAITRMSDFKMFIEKKHRKGKYDSVASRLWNEFLGGK